MYRSEHQQRRPLIRSLSTQDIYLDYSDYKGLIQPTSQQQQQRQSSYREAQRNTVFLDGSNFNIFDLFPKSTEPEFTIVKQSKTFPAKSAHKHHSRTSNHREFQRRSVFDASSNFNGFEFFPEEPEVSPIKHSQTLPTRPTHQQRPRSAGYREAQRRSVFDASSNFNVLDLFPQKEAEVYQPKQHKQPKQPQRPEQLKRQHSAMAAIIFVGVAIGAEKLGRKISEKRQEKKQKKAAERALMYSHAESSMSTSHVSRDRSWSEDSRPERKSEEARRERRRSLSSERPSVRWEDECAPPRYEEAVRGNARRS